jgi:four helix bundle suffix protein
MTDLLPPDGGYRKLKSFQMAQIIYDVTVRFCDKYIDRFSRTRDQMIQAARSGVQNIAEGSSASGTSKKSELKLTQVARASLEELLLDYQDFLRQRDYQIWSRQDPLRQSLVDRRCQSADDVACWVRDATGNQPDAFPAYSANAVLVLIAVTTFLLDRQINRLALDFEEHGGFSEKLYRVRSNKRSKS